MSPRVRRVLTGLVIAVIAYEALAYSIDEFTPNSSGGATSSSYTTDATGVAAYAELLQRTGHPVRRLRAALARTDLRSDAFVVVLDPTFLAPADERALRGYVEDGGTLLIGGSEPGAYLPALMPHPPTWSDVSPLDAYRLQSSPYTDDVGRVRSAGDGEFTSAGGGAQPAIGAHGNALLETATLGAGHLLLLADVSPLQNAYLDRADNAALGVALAGPAGRPVTFVESVHGYGNAAGLASLPLRWKWALAGLLLAALAWVAARFRRLGDPDPVAQTPQPPRRAHVEAIAVALQRTRQPAAAVVPVHDRARELVVRAAGLPPDAGAEAVAHAARQLGLDELEARSVAALDIPRSDDDVLVPGRALTKLLAR
jgi:hypothetical protein